MLTFINIEYAEVILLNAKRQNKRGKGAFKNYVDKISEFFTVEPIDPMLTTPLLQMSISVPGAILDT